jgi:putative pyruvate formate lyase activating enzyme
MSEATYNVASVCIHKGEEPVISGSMGICNIFFTNCNLQCIYCQNHQISENRRKRKGTDHPLKVLIGEIVHILNQGITHVGFVSPSHVIPQIRAIIESVESAGFKPVWVYNSNGYDKVESLKELEGVIDIYLPDMKYLDEDLAEELSGARDYPHYAMSALREMFRQKGAALHLDDRGIAISGMIVRHLVLPGHINNSINVLKFLAEELSPKIHISLMSQYYPTEAVRDHPHLSRRITSAEYTTVVEEMEQLGLYRGWVQEFESSDFYRPDFDLDHPFER